MPAILNPAHGQVRKHTLRFFPLPPPRPLPHSLGVVATVVYPAHPTHHTYIRTPKHAQSIRGEPGKLLTRMYRLSRLSPCPDAPAPVRKRALSPHTGPHTRIRLRPGSCGVWTEAECHMPPGAPSRESSRGCGTSLSKNTAGLTQNGPSSRMTQFL